MLFNNDPLMHIVSMTGGILETTGGDIIALIVPGKPRLFGLLGYEDDYVIPWNCIRRIGSDIILIEADLGKIKVPCKRKKYF